MCTSFVNQDSSRLAKRDRLVNQGLYHGVLEIPANLAVGIVILNHEVASSCSFESIQKCVPYEPSQPLPNAAPSAPSTFRDTDHDEFDWGHVRVCVRR